MCEVRSERKWRAGPVTTAMRALLTQMAAIDAPVITDWGKRTHDTTLNGQPVSGATLNGLVIRGLASFVGRERYVSSYRLTRDGHHLVRADAERAAGMEGDG